MKKTSIKTHMNKYSIFSKRATTINHAFASAMALRDIYSDEKMDEVLADLGCVKDGKIICVYCDKNEALTWDHLNALVKRNSNGKPSGFGHTYSNLVPCCKTCNSSKGNRHWELAIDYIHKGNPDMIAKRKSVITRFIQKYTPSTHLVSEDIVTKLEVIKQKIFECMKEADRLLEND